MHAFTALVADRTALPPKRVEGCLKLLEEGNTIPFIARYRKEQTGALTEVEIRAIEDAFGKLKELGARRETVLKSIEEQGLLTDDLRKRIAACRDRQELEDLYLPFKPKRKTRASVARAAGLEPLAEMMLGRRPCSVGRFQAAREFIKPENGIDNAEAALAGARDIVSEEITNATHIRQALRKFTWERAELVSKKKRGASEEAVTYSDYFDHKESLLRAPSHRFLALQRGERAGALSLKVLVDDERCAALLRRDLSPTPPHLFRQDIIEATEDGWKRLLWPALQRDLLATVKERSDLAASEVFENNLRALLMTPPARNQRVLAIDPGFRNGCKCAAIDATGKVLATVTVYPHQPQAQHERAVELLAEIVRKHRIDVLAVGDGTAHRESMALFEKAQWPGSVTVEAVREAGASVYSASELAGQELPDMDVTLRGAVSIARRYQDPLAELVKIDPKAIGVGQYQHDVDEKLLERGLGAVIEECVNRVGVELNTASPSLLGRVAGIGPKLAGAVVAHRNRHGPFASRKALLKVPGLGPAKFTQGAGFLRVVDGREPLDATAIHPERYDALKRAARTAGVTIAQAKGDRSTAAQLGPHLMQAGGMGKETVLDILKELVKPGHDPRGVREIFRFAEGIHKVSDLRPGMVLPGRVTSVTNFGAFVDLGIHRNGLVHISQLADRRVANPFEVVQPLQTVRVKVLEIDEPRNRISLTMKPSEIGG
jgi:protein Tex